MAISALILVTVIATSMLSGIIGMAGGMILMALLTLLLSVPTAMLLHGVTQGVANGSRAWLLREHIRWQVLPAYCVGVATCVAVFAMLALVPEPGVVLVLIGLLPWLGRLLPVLDVVDIQRPLTAASCGALITAAQLLAGASGPLLDVFFLRAPLTRHQIVATKACTQTLGHLVKLGYYAGILAASAGAVTPGMGLDPGLGTRLGTALPGWIFVAVIPCAVVGTRLGTGMLDRLAEADFRRVSERIILAIGAACTGTGLLQMVVARW